MISIIDTVAPYGVAIGWIFAGYMAYIMYKAIKTLDSL